MSALLLCGAAFALSSALVWEGRWRFAAPALLLCVPPVLYVTVETLWAAPGGVLLGLGAAAQASYLAVILRFGKGRRVAGADARAAVAQRWGWAILGCCTVWLGYEVLHGQMGNS